MRRDIIIIIGLIFCCSSVIADSCYKTLGISVSKKKRVVLNKTIKEDNISIKIIDKKDRVSSLDKLFKHTKIKKISKDKTLYGVGVNYNLSKRVQLSLDILAKLNIKKSSKLIEDETANLKIALSL